MKKGENAFFSPGPSIKSEESGEQAIHLCRTTGREYHDMAPVDRFPASRAQTVVSSCLCLVAEKMGYD